MSQEKVFQVRNNPNVQFWEVSQEEQEKLVNICGWQGRVLFTQPAAPAVTVDTPEFRDLLTTYWANNESQRKVIAKLLIDHIDAHAAAVAAKAVEKERTAKEHATQQAQQHAMEARTQRETVLSILRHFGLPENDWEALSLIKASAPQQHAQAALSDEQIDALRNSLMAKLEAHRMVRMFDVEEDGSLGGAHHLVDRLSLDAGDISADISTGKEEIEAIVDAVLEGAEEYTMSIIAKQIHDRACTCAKCLAEFEASQQPAAAPADSSPRSTCNCPHIGECDGSCAPYIAQRAVDGLALPEPAGVLHDDWNFTWTKTPPDVMRAGWKAPFYTEDQMRSILAAAPAVQVLDENPQEFVDYWIKKYQYSSDHAFLDSNGNFITPEDDPIHMGWVTWKDARAALTKGQK